MVKNKPLVMYHANCADGFGAAFAAWLKLGDDAEYLPMSYGQLDTPQAIAECFDCSIAERTVYILDFSLKHPAMDWLFAHAGKVVWLDHHKSAFEMWVENPPEKIHCPTTGKPEAWLRDDYQSRHVVRLDNNKSGAYLAWEFFHPGTEVPMLVRHIDDHDRWQFKLDGTKAFNKALWSYAPWSFKQWVDWFYDCEQEFSHTYWADFYTEGEAILRAHEQNVQSVVKRSARGCRIEFNEQMVPSNDQPEPIRFFEFRTGLAANCPPHLTSDVGHQLALQSGTFGLCWTLSQEGLTANCSLRSNGDYDVSAIAKSFGGGGHRNAAGFEVPLTTLLEWLA